MTDLAIQEIARALHEHLEEHDPPWPEVLAQAAYAVARKHIEAEVRIEALEQAAKLVQDYAEKVCGDALEPISGHEYASAIRNLQGEG